MFDKFTETDIADILMYAESRDKIADLLVKICQDNGFEGVVLEVWFQLAGRIKDTHLLLLVEHLGKYTALAHNSFCGSFLSTLISAKVLQMNGLETILVVPPLRDDKAHLELFSSKHFEALYPLIAAFSLVTYDFSNPQRPGANSPLHWIKHAVKHVCPETLTNFKTKRQKILIGMNLYGMDYTLSGGDSGPIVGHQFLDLLKNLKGRLVHDEHDEENFFEIK